MSVAIQPDVVHSLFDQSAMYNDCGHVFRNSSPSRFYIIRKKNSSRAQWMTNAIIIVIPRHFSLSIRWLFKLWFSLCHMSSCWFSRIHSFDLEKCCRENEIYRLPYHSSTTYLSLYFIYVKDLYYYIVT